MKIRIADLRSVAQLAAQGTAGVTRIVEGVHQSVWTTLGVPGRAPGRTGGITGLIYRSIHGVTQLVAKSVDTALARLAPLIDSAAASPPDTPWREAVLAALNGVMGDRLAASGNPLATPMTLRHRGGALEQPTWQHLPGATGKVLLLVHGLCMNDLQWQTQHDGAVVDHGAAIAAALGYTPLYLRYNTGLHVSQNGRALSDLLEQLAARWPQPLEEIAIVAHSMGGLVARSACHQAGLAGMRWPEHLKSIVFLGTPHHGAPLERAGNWVDVFLGSTMYTAPFARLAQLRSAGITDLRHGYLVDEDWQGQDRFRRQPDDRRAVPLPEGVACYAVAATTAGKRSPLAQRLVGDGLVPVPSALGRHADPARNLVFPKASELIAYRTNHMQLLGNPEVTQQLLRWLAPG